MKFILLCFLYALVFFVLVYFLGDSFLFQLRTFTASSIALVLKAMGLSVTTNSTRIICEGTILNIIFECTGLDVFAVFLACVLAYPATFKEKSWGTLVGLISIYLINIVRLVVIFFVLKYNEKMFRLVHNYLWRFLFFGIILLIWILWVEKIVANPSKNKIPA